MLVASWFGTLPGWLTLAVLVGGAWLATKGNLGPALGYYREANAALERENSELKNKLADERKENATLRAKTDLEPMQAALLESLKTHEQRAEQRHTSTLVVLDLIAARLGPNHAAT